jgi:hypothetical protein
VTRKTETLGIALASVRSQRRPDAAGQVVVSEIGTTDGSRKVSERFGVRLCASARLIVPEGLASFKREMEKKTDGRKYILASRGGWTAFDQPPMLNLTQFF